MAGGKSDSCERPTKSSARQRAQTISVQLGRSETRRSWFTAKTFATGPAGVHPVANPSSSNAALGGRERGGTGLSFGPGFPFGIRFAQNQLANMLRQNPRFIRAPFLFWDPHPVKRTIDETQSPRQKEQ